jgi:four helix bundle protein
MNFEFRNLKVYQLAKEFHKEMKLVIVERKADRFINDQLSRASLSIALNIAEGYGRFHKADKKNFYINARASVNECVACLDIMFDSKVPDQYLEMAEKLGKMLSGLVNAFKS